MNILVFIKIKKYSNILIMINKYDIIILSILILLIIGIIYKSIICYILLLFIIFWKIDQSIKKIEFINYKICDNNVTNKLLVYNISDLFLYNNKNININNLKKLLNYDIICLQEAFTKPFNLNNSIEEYLNKNGYDVYLSDNPKLCDRYLVNGGLLTAIKKYKKISITKKFIEFTNYNDCDSLGKKGFLIINFKYTNLCLINTHLQSDYNNNEFPYIDGINKYYRIQQIKQINKYIAGISGKKILLCGDFNFDNKEEIDLFLNLKNKYIYKYDGIMSNKKLKLDNIKFKNFFNSDHKGIEFIFSNKLY